MGTKRGEGKRLNCIRCSKEFPARGRKVACSEECSQAHKDEKAAVREANKPVKETLCTDKSDKAYILERILINEESGCWEWQKSIRQETGYGHVAQAILILPIA